MRQVMSNEEMAKRITALHKQVNEAADEASRLDEVADGPYRMAVLIAFRNLDAATDCLKRALAKLSR